MAAADTGWYEYNGIAMILLFAGFFLIVGGGLLLAQKGIDTPEYIRATGYAIGGAICTQIPRIFGSRRMTRRAR